MKRLPDSALVLASAGMEFSWIYALAAFIMSPILNGPYPLPDAMAIFVLSASLTAFSKGRGWRIVQILLAHGCGLALFMARSIHFMFYRSELFWSRQWGAAFFNRSLDTAQHFFLFVFLTWTLLLWIAGVRLALRPRTYLATCTRLDIGFASFFGILIIKLIMHTQYAARSGEVLSEYMIYSFFIFALLSVALARNQSGVRKVFLAGFRGIGLLFSFSVGILLFGTGLILVFLPYLQMVSDAGYDALQTAMKPLTPFVIALFRLIFMHGNRRSAGSAGSPVDSGGMPAAVGESTTWSEWLLIIITWGFLGILGLVAIVLVLIGIWFLLRWLFAKTAVDGRQLPGHQRFLGWLGKWTARLFAACDRLRSIAGQESAIHFYTALLRWGRRSGMPKRPCETPLEYGKRLQRQFADVAAEIDAIVAVANHYAYGNTAADPDQTTATRSALRKLQSPLLWPNRFKTRLLSIQ